MKDRVEELGKRIVKSDLWNIGLHGIFVKKVDKINMSETSANITKKVILGLETLAIGATAWACAKGYIAPTQESNTGNDNNYSEVDPSLNEEQSNQEKLVNYGQFLIGEAKIGKISDLTLQINPNQETVDKIKDLAYQIIPEAKDKDLSVNIYDMVGDKGTAPFVTVSINDEDGNLEFAYVGFSIDENNVQRPPEDGNIQIFYPLRVVEQDDNSNFVGIPDVTAQNLQVPVMFFIDNQGNSYFYPPYTDYVAQEFNPSGGMKVSAIILKNNEASVESPLFAEFKDLQERLGDEYKLTQEGEYAVIKGIENLKFNKDGTAELKYNSEDLTIAFQAISLDGEKLNIGPWQHDKEGNVTMLTAPAPKTVEDVNSFPKLAYLIGHAKEKEIDATIHKYLQMTFEKTATYDPKNEFEGYKYDEYEVDPNNLPITRGWIVNEYNAGKTVSYFPDNDNIGSAIALSRGWSSLEIYDTSGKQIHNLMHVPIMDYDTDKSIVITSGLINSSQLPMVLEQLNREERKGFPFFTTIIKDTEVSNPNFMSDDKLRAFMAYYNKTFFDMDILGSNITKLPPEVSTMLYLDFLQN